MSFNNRDPKPSNQTEDIDPTPWLGRSGNAATLPSGEYISSRLREMAEHERAHRVEEHLNPRNEQGDRQDSSSTRTRR